MTSSVLWFIAASGGYLLVTTASHWWPKLRQIRLPFGGGASNTAAPTAPVVTPAIAPGDSLHEYLRAVQAEALKYGEDWSERLEPLVVEAWRLQNKSPAA